MQNAPTSGNESAGAAYSQSGQGANQASKDDFASREVQQSQQPPMGVGQFALIAGIALLVLSVMLFLLGWLRARQRN